jgi:hypothetical protein
VNDSFDSAASWQHFYFWGVSSKPPAELELQTRQLQALLGVVEVDATLASLAAFEPRYLINHKGVTAWMLLFVFAFANNREGLGAVAEGKASLFMPAEALRGSFESHVAWPPQLLAKYSFDFGQHWPFVIPFIRYRNAPAPRPLKESLKSPDGSIEIMGVAEFDEQRPEALLALFHDFHARYGSNYA